MRKAFFLVSLKTDITSPFEQTIFSNSFPASLRGAAEHVPWPQ
jgi:hypothetical protein